jgi:hypothetical protein
MRMLMVMMLLLMVVLRPRIELYLDAPVINGMKTFIPINDVGAQ